MKSFAIEPQLIQLDTGKKFCEKFHLGKGDLILSNQYIYEPYFSDYCSGAVTVFVENYGSGEPSDEMVENICKDMKGQEFYRVFGIGGGTVLDIAKLFALETVLPVCDLYTHKFPAIRNKELFLIPTTCGTGSEITNISILELKSLNTKMGLAEDALFADKAILIPELLGGLPFRYFATSSIDALVHAVESYLSPKATPFSSMYSVEAVRMILSGYQTIARCGEKARLPLLSEFQIASTYAGIAFGNAGCAAVHAMSYPLGAKYHVAHGESNYALFTEVLKAYQRLNPEGRIQALKELLAGVLQCKEEVVYDTLEQLLNNLCEKKRLREYGVKKEELYEFTRNVMNGQQRLMANNYTELSENEVYRIYQKSL